jgi:hypothetical protein
MRKTYTLTNAEITLFGELRPIEGKAFQFWKTVAADQGLDYSTMIHIVGSHTFSALPITKRKRASWCYPIARLKCKLTPEQVTREGLLT